MLEGMGEPPIYPLYVFSVIPRAAHISVFVMHRRPRSASILFRTVSPHF
nr:MAG TPA: hypothetical protein [Caudoviricetes sp.]